MPTNPDIDIVAYIIAEVLKAKPTDAFCKSIQVQYIERGGLSKKQLEGLQGKALRIEGLHPGKLATLEAIIKKKHVTHRSTITHKIIEPQKDEAAEKMITQILEKYPQHKRVLLFKTLYLQQQTLPTLEKAELEKFYKILLK